MPFRLKNADAIYQGAMNVIFHDMVDKSNKVYIDDVMIKVNLDKEHTKNQR